MVHSRSRWSTSSLSVDQAEARRCGPDGRWVDLLLKALHVELSVKVLSVYLYRDAECLNVYAGRVCTLNLLMWSMGPNFMPENDNSEEPRERCTSSGVRDGGTPATLATPAGQGDLVDPATGRPLGPRGGQVEGAARDRRRAGDGEGLPTTVRSSEEQEEGIPTLHPN